jgi:nicotinamidase-related amidase
VRELLPADAIFEKVCFSCVADGVLAQRPIYGREQWVIVGTEAHVCVLQTALDLAAAGKRVFVAADAVGSRDPRNRDLALARMGQQGAQIVSREMVAFEWLRRAGSERFREINRDFIR